MLTQTEPARRTHARPRPHNPEKHPRGHAGRLPASDGAVPLLQGQLPLLQLHHESGKVFWSPEG
jgi:hypothetical protein